MAWSYTDLDTVSASGAAPPLVSNSISPTAGRLLIVEAVAHANASTSKNAYLRTTLGLDFVSLAQYDGAYSTTNFHGLIAAAIVPDGYSSSGTVSAYTHSATVTDFYMGITEWSGWDSSRVVSPWTRKFLATATATSATSCATASVSPAANRMLTLAIRQEDDAFQAPSSVSGLGLTWNLVGTTTGGSMRITVYNAVTGGSAPTPGAVTVNWGATQNYIDVELDEWAGHDTSKTAAQLVVQTGTGNLAAFSQPDNLYFTVASNTSNSSSELVLESPFTVIYETRTVSGTGSDRFGIGWNAGETDAVWGHMRINTEFLAATSSTPRLGIQSAEANTGGTSGTVTLATFANGGNLCLAMGVSPSGTNQLTWDSPMTTIHTVNSDMRLAYYVGDIDPAYSVAFSQPAHAEAAEIAGTSGTPGWGWADAGADAFWSAS